MTAMVPTRPGPPSETTAPGSAGRRVTAAIDLLMLSAMALLATWTVCYLAALVGLVASAVAFAGWVVTAPVVVVLVVRRCRMVLDAVPASSPWVPLTVSVLFAVGASVIVRPDLDDASYVVRSTWIAARGDVRVGDVIFSDGAWHGMAFQTPYVPGVEALWGWVARTTGISAGTVVYVLVPPVAAFLGMWALAMLLRAWRARNVSAAVVLAGLFLVMGGATHASWGNLNLARIWQGKVLLLAVLVPLVFFLAAAYWYTEGRSARRTVLALVGTAGIAAVGLSPAGVFVVPAIVLISTLPGLLRRELSRVGALFLVGAAPGLLAGAGVLLFGASAEGEIVPPATVGPWQKVLGTGLPAAVVVVAAGAAVLACLWPRRWATCGEVGRWTAVGAVAAGALIAVPAVYDLAAEVMGTNAIAWRLTWVVPVPALVGLLAGFPRWGRVPTGGLVALAAAAGLVVGGLPLWSAQNGAWVAPPGQWKVPSSALEAARWIAEQRPNGPVLAPTETSAALGAVTADVSPVGSRADYMVMYLDVPAAHMEERLALQRLADGVAIPADVEAAPHALTLLGVEILCGRSGDRVTDGLALSAGLESRFENPAVTCYARS